MNAPLPPKAIIFDFDGVIADSEIASTQAFSAALTEVGLPTTPDEAAALYVGLIRQEVLQAMAARWGKRLPANITERVQHHVDMLFGPGIEPVPGAADFIDSVAHLPIAIGSSSYTDYIRDHLGRFGLEHHFGPHVYSGREHVTRGKPHPDIYLHAAAALGVAPHEAVVIEDSPIGARAAVASGARVIGLLAGSHVHAGLPDALRREGVEIILPSYADVAVHLGVSADRA